MALAIRLSPQLSQARIMGEKGHHDNGLVGFFRIGQAGEPVHEPSNGGEQARMYPVIMMRHICMANSRRLQKPGPKPGRICSPAAQLNLGLESPR